MLGQGLVVEVHGVLVALLLEVRVADAGVRSAFWGGGRGREEQSNVTGCPPPKTCSPLPPAPLPPQPKGALCSLGDLPVVLPVLPAHLNGFFAQLTAAVVVALLKVDGCKGGSGLWVRGGEEEGAVFWGAAPSLAGRSPAWLVM